MTSTESAAKENEELSLGIPEIDAAHQLILELVSQIEALVKKQSRWMDVHSALVQLAEQARFHFAVEESLMRLYDYPMLTAHATEHRQLSLDVATLMMKSLTAPVSEDMVASLRPQWRAHILTNDTQYAVHFRSHVGAPMDSCDEVKGS